MVVTPVVGRVLTGSRSTRLGKRVRIDGAADEPVMVCSSMGRVLRTPLIPSTAGPVRTLGLRSGEAKDFGSESTIPRIEQLLLVGTSASPARLLDMGLAQSLLMLNGRHLRTFSQHSLH